MTAGGSYVYVGSLHASSPNESSAFFCFFGFLGFPAAFSLSFFPGAFFGSLSSSSAETRILRFPSDCAFRSASLSGLEVEKDRLGLSVLDLESSGFASSVPSVARHRRQELQTRARRLVDVEGIEPL